MGILAALAVSVASSNAIVLNFDALAGTELNFPGNGTFGFTSTNGYQFQITTVTEGTGDAQGLDGYITPGGPFTIGPITTNGWVQSAKVSGTSMLHITDSSSIDLTAQIDWSNITTFNTAGVLNLDGAINLSDIEYTGSNSDLLTLLEEAGGTGSDTVTFQFNPAESLSQLASTGGETSYSGSISAVPEPASSVLILGGLAALYCFFRFRRSAS